MIDKTLRVAVIGAGYFARFQIESWQRLNNVQLVGVCDLNDAALDCAREIAPAIATFNEAQAMLTELAPDLVDIATPPSTHRQLVELCAQRKIAVVCQKPLADSLDEAHAIVAIAETAEITLIVHENFRFMPWNQEIKRLIEANHFGKLHGITMRLRPGDGQGPSAYLQRQPYFQQMKRFLIHETAIHQIDTFRFLCGEISGVFARLRRLNPKIRGEDAGIVIFDFTSGAAGLFDGNRLNEHPSDNTRRTMGELWLEGESGVMRLDGHGRLWWQPHGGKEVEHNYQWDDRAFGGDCVYRLQEHVVRHLQGSQEAHNSARCYLRNIVIEQAIYQSAEEQRWIAV